MGILAERMLGYKAGAFGCWGAQAAKGEEACDSRWEEIPGTMAALIGMGLYPADMTNLEFLSDKEVLDRIGASQMNFQGRENVILYMLAWADILQEEADVQGLMSTEGVPFAEPQVPLSAAISPASPPRIYAAIGNATLV